MGIVLSANTTKHHHHLAGCTAQSYLAGQLHANGGVGVAGACQAVRKQNQGEGTLPFVVAVAVAVATAAAVAAAAAAAWGCGLIAALTLLLIQVGILAVWCLLLGRCLGCGAIGTGCGAGRRQQPLSACSLFARQGCTPCGSKGHTAAQNQYQGPHHLFEEDVLEPLVLCPEGRSRVSQGCGRVGGAGRPASQLE